MGCLEGLAEVERGSAWAMLGVCAGVVVWLVAVVVVGGSGEMGERGRVLGEVDEDEHGAEEQGVGRRIEYRDDEELENGDQGNDGGQRNGTSKGSAVDSDATKTGNSGGRVRISDLVDDVHSWDRASGR